MPRTLAFGDDQSASADVAWLWVNCHPWPGWQVEVITATPEAGAGSPVLEPWDPPHPRRLLDSAPEVPVTHHRVRADPRTALGSCVDQDLLVVGPKGKGLGKQLHLGSTSEWLIHDPPIPLVIARKGQPTSRVLVCADGSDHVHRALQAFGTMPWVEHTDVLVATVPEGGIDPAAATESAVARLGDRPASVRATTLRPDPLLVAYQTRDMLLEAAHTWDADLIVMGTRGLSWGAAVRAGSIATSLAVRAPCSVLMARAW